MIYTRFMKKELISYVLVLIVSLFLTADLFLHPGRSITFDGHVHITTIAQFYNALRDGEFPVTWANGFANYGLPIPLVAHQTTSYLGALLQFFTHNPVLAYNIVILIGVFLSSSLFYRFLRYYFSQEVALVSATLFHFAPYRITNIYVRGAIPEVFGAVFLPVVLIGLYQFLHEKKRLGLLLIILGTTMLALTHPMMLILSSVVILPFALSLLWPLQKHILDSVKIGLAGVLGLSIAGYYLLPLLVEIKYFSYGTTANHFRGQAGSLQFPSSFFESWSYFDVGHPGPRENTLTIGTIETVILLIGITVLIWLISKKKLKKIDWPVLSWIMSGLLALFLMSKASLFLYEHISVLSNIQYQWRNLSGMMYVAPFVLGWLLTKINKPFVGIILILVIGCMRIPQSYGKNYMVYDLSHYDVTKANLHTNNMNTLWMGDSRDYPTRTEQVSVIEGTANIENLVVKNAKRQFSIQSENPVRMADYTFYFPGWKVLVDGQPVEIQFQDPAYRGMITYHIPAGNHQVLVEFGQTKIRVFGYLLTLVGLTATILFMLFSDKTERIFLKRKS